MVVGENLTQKRNIQWNAGLVKENWQSENNYIFDNLSAFDFDFCLLKKIN